ncbi:hypothetical protein AMJ51_01920 [Microgenomates bacterium DG_75]|nr:MAG: hypothetical protein AMJ51_01920 [Microgenomates bacterium DG_75]
MKESISIIITAYNEEKNIEKVVNLTFKVLKKAADDYEVIVVDDGSEDKTHQILKRLQKKYRQLRIIKNPKNLGIGNSLKILFKAARKNLVFFIPADGQIKATELPKFLKKSKDYDLICGSTWRKGYPFYRKILSYLYNLLLRVFYKTGVKNADSAKFIKRRVLKSIKLESNSDFVDAELIAKARKYGFKITELPIRFHPRTSGKSSALKLNVILPKILDFLIFLPKIIFYQPRRDK